MLFYSFLLIGLPASEIFEEGEFTENEDDVHSTPS